MLACITYCLSFVWRTGSAGHLITSITANAVSGPSSNTFMTKQLITVAARLSSWSTCQLAEPPHEDYWLLPSAGWRARPCRQCRFRCRHLHCSCQGGTSWRTGSPCSSGSPSHNPPGAGRPAFRKAAVADGEGGCHAVPGRWDKKRAGCLGMLSPGE